MGYHKYRQSNIELLRIMAMILVLAVHVNYLPLGHPTQADFLASPAATTTRVTFEAISVICVNLFVMISGWFSIKPSIKGFVSFMYQFLFIGVGIYAVAKLAGYPEYGGELKYSTIFLEKGYWFVGSYIGLYILAPVINRFVETVSERQLRLLLIAFFAFEAIFGCVGNIRDIVRGYSTFSFIGLYMLARYCRLYLTEISSTTLVWLYILSLTANIAIGFVPILNLSGTINAVATNIFLAYTNPLSIIQAACLLMIFSRMKIKSRTINFFAASSFAVYLVHIHDGIFPLYKKMATTLFASYSSWQYLIAIAIGIAGWYAIGVAIDQLRIISWNFILRMKEKHTQLVTNKINIGGG